QHGPADGFHTAVDVLLTQARANGALFHDLDRGDQRTGTQQQRQVVGFVGVVDAGDAELAAKARLDGGDVDHLLLLAELALAVRTRLTDRLVFDEYGGHALTDVVLGKVGHLVATLAIELDVDLGT